MGAATKSDRARLFFALWPSTSVQARLAALASDVRGECGGRAMAQEKIHLTLFFVGSIERTRMPALERAASEARAKRFSLVIDRLGYWRHNQIVWAGTGRCPAELEALAASLRVALAAEGVEGEERPYAPHVTLVRNAERKPAVRAIEPCEWRADEFVLVESVSVRGGVRYEPCASWALG